MKGIQGEKIRALEMENLRRDNYLIRWARERNGKSDSAGRIGSESSQGQGKAALGHNEFLGNSRKTPGRYTRSVKFC